MVNTTLSKNMTCTYLQSISTQLPIDQSADNDQEAQTVASQVSDITWHPPVWTSDRAINFTVARKHTHDS